MVYWKFFRKPFSKTRVRLPLDSFHSHSVSALFFSLSRATEPPQAGLSFHKTPHLEPVSLSHPIWRSHHCQSGDRKPWLTADQKPWPILSRSLSRTRSGDRKSWPTTDCKPWPTSSRSLSRTRSGSQPILTAELDLSSSFSF